MVRVRARRRGAAVLTLAALCLLELLGPAFNTQTTSSSSSSSSGGGGGDSGCGRNTHSNDRWWWGGSFLPAVSAAKDYYAVLKVPRDATDKQINKAYRNLAGKHHPDKGGDPDKFREIAEAKDVLTDSDKRRNYDRYGDPDGPQRGGGGFSSFFRTRQKNNQVIYSETPLLTRHNIDHYLDAAANGVLIIEFQANWCDECRRLSEYWDEAARSLEGIVTLARINTDQEPYITRRYNVRSLPAIVAVTNGEFTRYRTTPRSAGDIRGFASRFLPDYVNVVDSLRAYRRAAEAASDRPVVVLFSSRTTPAPMYKHLALRFYGYIRFVQVPTQTSWSTTLREELGAEGRKDMMIIREGYDPERYDGPLEREPLEKWLHERRFVAVPKLTDVSGHSLCGKHADTHCLIFLDDGTRARTSFVAALAEVAKTSEGVQPAWVDVKVQTEVASLFSGVRMKAVAKSSGDDSNACLVYFDTSRLRARAYDCGSGSGTVSADGMKAWLEELDASLRMYSLKHGLVMVDESASLFSRAYSWLSSGAETLQAGMSTIFFLILIIYCLSSSVTVRTM